MRLIPWHLSGAADTYSPLLNLAHIESTSPLLPVLLSTCQMLCRLSTMRWRSSSASARAQEVKDYETYRSKHCLEGKQGIPARTHRPPWPVRWKPRPGDHTDAIRESPWPQRGWKWADKNLQQTRREAVWGLRETWPWWAATSCRRLSIVTTPRVYVSDREDLIHFRFFSRLFIFSEWW